MRHSSTPFRGGSTYLVLAWIVIPLPQAQADDAKLSKYRLTKLGFSVGYPADWVKRPVTGCGYGLIWKTQEELLQTEIFPVRFSEPNEEAADSYMTVSLIRRFDGDLSDYLGECERRTQGAFAGDPCIQSSSTEFALSSGEIGKRLVCHYETERFIEEPPHTQPRNESLVSYVVVAKGRVFQFRGVCLTSEFEATQDLFDAIVFSLRVFEPYSAANQAMPWTTYYGLGFAFDFPGDWIMALSDDDDVNNAQWAIGQTRISEPRSTTPFDILDFAPSIRSSIFPVDEGEKATIEQAATDYMMEIQGPPTYSLSVASYQNRIGAKCREIRVRYDFPSGRFTYSRVFLLQRADGRVQTLTCMCNGLEVDKMQVVFDHVRYSFVATD